MSAPGNVHLFKGQFSAMETASPHTVVWICWCHTSTSPPLGPITTTYPKEWAIDPVAADCDECLAAYNAALVSKSERAAINAGITPTRVQLNRTLPEGVAPSPARVTYIEGPRPGAPFGSPINLPQPTVMAGESALPGRIRVERKEGLRDLTPELESDLARIINKHSLEGYCGNTPDFIVGQFLAQALHAFAAAARERVRFKTGDEPQRPTMNKPITGW